MLVRLLFRMTDSETWPFCCMEGNEDRDMSLEYPMDSSALSNGKGKF